MSAFFDDVIVLGGGVIGLSIARNLAIASQKRLKISLWDKNLVAQEASRGAAGMLAAQIETSEDSDLFKLMLQSRELFADLALELKAETGLSIGYSQEGIGALAVDVAEAEALKARAQWQAAQGLKAEWLGRAVVLKNFPHFTGNYLGALYSPDDGQVAAAAFTQALRQSAEKWGVGICEKQDFRLLWKDGRIAGLELKNGVNVCAQKYIVAAGAWTAQILPEVPVFPVQGQILSYGLPQSLRQWKTPFYIGTARAEAGESSVACYLAPKLTGELLLGATSIDAGFSKMPDRAASERMQAYAAKIFPELSECFLQSVWVGLRPKTPDARPILGALSTDANTWVACGHFRNGILLSPITAQLAAEWVLTGKTRPSLTAFSPLRFSRQKIA